MKKDHIDYTNRMVEMSEKYENQYDLFERKLHGFVNAKMLKDEVRVDILTLVDDLVEMRGQLEFEHGEKFPFRFFNPTYVYYRIKAYFDSKKMRKIFRERLDKDLDEALNAAEKKLEGDDV